MKIKNTPPKFNVAPEHGWLEDDPFLLGFGNFSGTSCETSGVYLYVKPPPSMGKFLIPFGPKKGSCWSDWCHQIHLGGFPWQRVMPGFFFKDLISLK